MHFIKEHADSLRTVQKKKTENLNSKFLKQKIVERLCKNGLNADLKSQDL